MMPATVTVAGPPRLGHGPPMTAPMPIMKIAMPKTRLVCVLLQPNAAMSGCVKLLHPYAVPARIITTTPAQATAQRFVAGALMEEPRVAVVDMLFPLGCARTRRALCGDNLYHHFIRKRKYFPTTRRLLRC